MTIFNKHVPLKIKDVRANEGLFMTKDVRANEGLFHD